MRKSDPNYPTYKSKLNSIAKHQNNLNLARKIVNSKGWHKLSETEQQGFIESIAAMEEELDFKIAEMAQWMEEIHNN